MPNDIIVVDSEIVEKPSYSITTAKKKDNYYRTSDVVYLTKAEVRKLIDGAENAFNKMLFLLLYETGGRVSEVIALRFMDVDYETRRVKLITLKQKTEKQVFRHLLITKNLLSLIKERRSVLNLSEEDFILTRKHTRRPITRHGVGFLLKKEIRRLLGENYIYKAHPHALRHTRAIHLLDSGMNIMLLKNFLGHANIANTLIYLRYSNKDMAEAIERANIDF